MNVIIWKKKKQLSTVDGEIKKILMTEKEKMNIKEIKIFIL